jgi:peptidoglycan/LPS O-acetylase OafA/YrhL
VESPVSTRDTYYLRGLDGLRFIGSTIILLHHVEGAKGVFGLPGHKDSFLETGTGQAAMTLFFVLSGFLISFILLREKKSTGNINLSRFYKKRILRIWPLYYFMVIFGVTVFFHSSLFRYPDTPPTLTTAHYPVLLLYFFNLSNLILFFDVTIRPLKYLWTMGVEEQFYSFWPVFTKKVGGFFKACIVFIVIKSSLKLVVVILEHVLPLNTEQFALLKNIEQFLFVTRFEVFAIGGIAAFFFLEQKQKILGLIYRRDAQILNLVMLVACFPLTMHFQFVHFFLAVNFSVLILNTVNNPKALFVLDFKITNYLGKISYGIYIYQMPMRALFMNLLKPYYTEQNSLVWNIEYYGATILATILVASLSYEFVEKRIMQMGRS